MGHRHRDLRPGEALRADANVRRVSETLAWIAAVTSTAWGVGHIIPTRNVVAGFGSISEHNRRIITMEWVAEGLTLIFLGVLIGLVTVVGSEDQSLVDAVYVATAVMFIVIGAWTAMTAARGGIIFFRLCPFVMGSGALLLLIAAAQ